VGTNTFSNFHDFRSTMAISLVKPLKDYATQVTECSTEKCDRV